MTVVYANNAATAWPKAPGVDQAVAEKIAAIPIHPGRAGFDAPDPETDCRKLLARLLRVEEANRILLTVNATHALNIALHGFPWRPRAVALTTVADHNAVLRPLYFLQKHGKIRVEHVDVDASGRVDMEKWAFALKKHRPQLAVFTHASNVTGSVNPVEEMCALAKSAGSAILLDVSQTMGIVEVLPQQWSADMVAFTGHKYLLGPPGTGGLYVAPRIDLEPVWVGGTGILSALPDMPPDLPARFDAGTPNSPAFAGLARALLWQREHPPSVSEIESRARRLAEGLLSLGVQVTEWRGSHTPVLSCTFPGCSVEDAGEMLYLSFDIICRTGLHCAPLIHRHIGAGSQGTVRFSLSRFTADEEVERIIAAAGRILA
ncbi:MAG: aminotransferase class V-fold PLP-dependent enzyme [Deltaproteobacteria bacterium]|jgi:selenocysteine lyase/cysteine desulfurase|nr:aminotransferase class V-fold PLP-dependent enzyme [Deltaproteobacteria bacterium]